MQNIKEEIHQKLLGAGRNLVKDKGQEFLTARKLSEASGCSIGTIYNQFSSMDDFVAEQNEGMRTDTKKTQDKLDIINSIKKLPCEDRLDWQLREKALNF